jgi:GT2 family glycosyltransferase
MVLETNIVSLPVTAKKRPISVIMVSYMTGPALAEAVSAVMNDDDIYELILVDNGNTESARARLSEIAMKYDRIRLLQGHGNIGFARGCNYGARLAKGHFLLFLNPDAIISQGAARRLADCGENLNSPWIAGGFLRDEYGREQRGARRGALTPLSAISSFTPLHKLPGFKTIHQETQPVPLEPIPIQTTSGAAMMTDRESFETLGGFDERYFLHVEDIDICRRTWESGGSVYIVPDAHIMHYGSTSAVPRIKVEWEKLKGFIRYFWNYKPGLTSKLLTTLAAPFMTLAIMGRAYYLTLRAALFGR